MINQIRMSTKHKAAILNILTPLRRTYALLRLIHGVAALFSKADISDVIICGSLNQKGM